MDIYSLNTILCLCVGICAFMFWLSFYPENLNFLMNRISNNSDFDKTIIQKDKSNFILTLLLPLAQKFAKKNHSKINRDAINKLDLLLDSAGRPLKITAVELYNMKFSGAIIFSGLFLLGGLSMNLGLLLTPIGLILGYVIAIAHVKTIAKKRTIMIDEELPNVLDLISVCLESTMPLPKTLEVICANNKGVLIEELTAVLNDTKRGASVTDGFKSLYTRSNSKKIKQLYSNIKLSEKLGTPIADSLKYLSSTVRQDTFELVKQKAAKAAVMVLFPVMFFILPAVMIITMGPALMNVMNS